VCFLKGNHKTDLNLNLENNKIESSNKIKSILKNKEISNKDFKINSKDKPNLENSFIKENKSKMNSGIYE